VLPSVDLSKPYIRVWLYALAVHAALFSIFYGPNGTGVLFIVVGGGVIFALARIYHDREALILFAAQVLYGYVFVGVVGLALSELFDAQFKRDSPLRLGGLLMFGIAGLGLGWATARRMPSAVSTAQWSWIVPVPLFAYSFLHDWLWRCQFCPDPKTTYFYPSAGLDGMLTFQAFSLAGYSIGSWIASRIRVQPRPPALL
jgi:hypothetical protein